MGLQELDRQLDDIRAKAGKTGEAWARDMREIDADTSLSDEGKRITRDQRFEKRREQMDAYRAEEHALVDKEIDTLERKLDGYVGFSSNDVIAFRDAADRAERVEQDRAGQMMDRALRTGDSSLAHALYRRGLDAGWSSVTKPFEVAKPDAAQAAKDLQTLRRFKSDGFSRAIAYHLGRG